MKPDRIHAVHKSMQGARRKPNNMERVVLSYEQYEALLDIAVSVFVDCTNTGLSFQDSLLAVYLTGMENALLAQQGSSNRV